MFSKHPFSRVTVIDLNSFILYITHKSPHITLQNDFKVPLQELVLYNTKGNNIHGVLQLCESQKTCIKFTSTLSIHAQIAN